MAVELHSIFSYSFNNGHLLILNSFFRSCLTHAMYALRNASHHGYFRSIIFGIPHITYLKDWHISLLVLKHELEGRREVQEDLNQPFFHYLHHVILVV
mgnify:CR=1 FL=1